MLLSRFVRSLDDLFGDAGKQQFTPVGMRCPESIVSSTRRSQIKAVCCVADADPTVRHWLGDCNDGDHCYEYKRQSEHDGHRSVGPSR
jgi:hypothetical protein